MNGVVMKGAGKETRQITSGYWWAIKTDNMNERKVIHIVYDNAFGEYIVQEDDMAPDSLKDWILIMKVPTPEELRDSRKKAEELGRDIEGEMMGNKVETYHDDCVCLLCGQRYGDHRDRCDNKAYCKERGEEIFKPSIYSKCGKCGSIREWRS